MLNSKNSHTDPDISNRKSYGCLVKDKSDEITPPHKNPKDMLIIAIYSLVFNNWLYVSISNGIGYSGSASEINQA